MAVTVIEWIQLCNRCGQDLEAQVEAISSKVRKQERGGGEVDEVEKKR